jgi:hypothetical protein
MGLPEVVPYIPYLGFRLDKGKVNFFEFRLNPLKVHAALFDGFLLSGDIAVLFGYILFELFKFAGERYAPFLNIPDFFFGIGNAPGKFIGTPAVGKKFFLDGFKQQLLARKFTAYEPGLFFGGLGLGRHAHAAYPEFFKRGAVLGYFDVEAAGVPAVFLNAPPSFSLQFSGLPYFCVKGPLFGNDALRGEEFVDKGRRASAVKLKEFRGFFAVGRGLAKGMDQSLGYAPEFRRFRQGAALSGPLSRQGKVPGQGKTASKYGFKPAQSLVKFSL